jgi:hypothetical protein
VIKKKKLETRGEKTRKNDDEEEESNCKTNNLQIK